MNKNPAFNFKLEWVFFLLSFVLILLISFLIGFAPITGDQIWGATATLGSPLDSIIFTLRFDLHPPLYYLLLDLWATISQTDFWLRASSMFLHSLIVLSTYTIAKKKFSVSTAIYASLFVFALPLLLSYSTQLRMYSLIALISLWQYHHVDNYSNGNDNRVWPILGLGILLANTHAIGILFVFFHFIYGACRLTASNNKKLIRWCAGHFVVVAFALPAVANSLFKSAGHAVAPSFNDVLQTANRLFLDLPDQLIYISVFIFLALVVSLSISKKTRLLVLCYLLLPLVMFAAISFLIKPLWLTRNFAFALPILAITLSIKLSEMNLPSKLKLAIPILFIIVNLSLWIENSAQTNSQNNFAKVTHYFRQETSQATGKICIVSVNQLNTFWSLLRYLDKPDWGHSLKIQPPTNERWQSTINKIPKDFARLLKLIDSRNYFENEQIVISSGPSDRCDKDDIDAVYLIAENQNIEEFRSEFSLQDRMGVYRIFKKN
ncbi:glycosyltransferase family 39 protein [Aliikangiella coralliicola]|uniref:Uncharacterized protein n=1 Tax=Aliikangiella coralliicola TaxID=2592383 RepID=A0A545UHF4_9GAMM|nr:glycosyltransferase family 39 protein [Aliikangiella coralliicola]TQV88895.1 hypothetical protein FLL46_05000 [Aliikangiella coralliicola]